MFTIIAFLLTIVGCINWLVIGLMQYDFIAGIFGLQASVFSRIFYILFGIASLFLVFKLIKGKGTIAVFSRRNKKNVAENIEKMQKSKQEEYSPVRANIEAGREAHERGLHQTREDDIDHEDYYRDDYEQESHGLFDEHLDDRHYKK